MRRGLDASECVVFRSVVDDLGSKEHRRACRLGQVALVHEYGVSIVILDVAFASSGEPLSVGERADAEVADFDCAAVRSP